MGFYADEHSYLKARADAIIYPLWVYVKHQKRTAFWAVLHSTLLLAAVPVLLAFYPGKTPAGSYPAF